MIKIYGQDGQVAGELSEEQFAYLREEFEEEGPEDADYFVGADTLGVLEESGADPQLVAVLRAAVAPAGEGEVRWSRD